MKKTKQIAALLAGVLLLAGCGQAANETAGSGANSAQASEGAAEDTEQEQTGASGTDESQGDESAAQKEEYSIQKSIIVLYEDDGRMSSWYESEYDESGNGIRVYDADGSAQRYEYEYDEFGNEIKMISFNVDGSVKYGWTREYDERGELIKISRLTATDGQGSETQETVTHEAQYFYSDGQFLLIEKCLFTFAPSTAEDGT